MGNDIFAIWCKIFGHKAKIVYEERYRGRYKSVRRFGYGYTKDKGGNWVSGTYNVCARCGKKLSAFTRCY